MDQTLKTLLNKSNVKFADLKIPLYVVATELGSNEPKVWSFKTTPQESVAYAVRCSCSIPGFFQPVDNKYVDGGIISNLPAYVFPTYSTDTGNSSALGFERTLCFSFKREVGDPTSSKELDLEVANARPDPFRHRHRHNT